MPRIYKRIRAGGQLSAAQENLKAASIEATERLTGTGGLNHGGIQVARSMGGLRVNHNIYIPFWAVIQAKGTDANSVTCYGWSELYQPAAQLGTWIINSDGRSGTIGSTPSQNTIPAYPVDGNANVPVDGSAVVLMWLGFDSESYLFVYVPAANASGQIIINSPTTYNANVSFGPSITVSYDPLSVLIIPVGINISSTTKGRVWVWSCHLNYVSDDGSTYQAERVQDRGTLYPNLSGGYVPTSQLGSGPADASHFLRGDQTWATAGGGGNATSTGTKYTGTTTNSWATLATISAVSGGSLHGTVSFWNTGPTNTMDFRLVYTDLDGNVSNGNTHAQAGGAGQPAILDLDNALSDTGSAMKAPVQSIQIQVQDDSAGSHTTYEVWAATVG